MDAGHRLGEGSDRTAGGTIDRRRPHPAPRRSVRGALWRAVLGAAAALGALVLAAAPARAGIAAKPAATWQTNGRVIAILDLGGITYVGGKFSRVSDHSGHTAAVANLAAFDTAGNLVAGWTPNANHPVKALAADGSRVLAGGAFTTIDGRRARHLALISTSGSLAPFAAHTNKEVDALAVAGGRVYAGGVFTRANGASRGHAAAFDTAGGALTAWDPRADGRVRAIVPAAAKIVLGGAFTHAAGAHAGHLTAVDPVTGTASTWHTGAPAAVLDLAEEDGSVFAAIAGKGGMVAAYAADSGGRLWQAQTDGNVQAITTAGGSVVAGGHFDNFCDLGTNCAHPVVRRKIAALDEGSGALDPAWHPSINSTLGVFAALGTSGRLEIGGDFTKVAGTAQAHYARFAIS
jgi:outer membrane protein assembly factor BamB